jgi:hypothetical protein
VGQQNGAPAQVDARAVAQHLHARAPLELLLDEVVAVPLDEEDRRLFGLLPDRLDLAPVVVHAQVLGPDPVVEEVADDVEGVAVLFEELQEGLIIRRIPGAQMNVADKQRARHPGEYSEYPTAGEST